MENKTLTCRGKERIPSKMLMRCKKGRMQFAPTENYIG